MAKFNLSLSIAFGAKLEESIDVEVDLETYKTLRKYIKDFLIEKKYL